MCIYIFFKLILLKKNKISRRIYRNCVREYYYSCNINLYEYNRGVEHNLNGKFLTFESSHPFYNSQVTLKSLVSYFSKKKKKSVLQSIMEYYP